MPERLPCVVPAPRRPAQIRKVRPIRLAALAGLASLAGLAGCGGDGGQFKPVCPQTAILADAADLTRYNGRGNDVTDMVLDGRILGLKGSCKQSGDQLTTEVSVDLEIARGPGSPGRDASFAYFVAVSDGDRILDKRIYPQQTSFPSNIEHLKLSTEPVEMTLPVTRSKSGAAYTIRVGFQLTPEELALNRLRGAR